MTDRKQRPTLPSASATRAPTAAAFAGYGLQLAITIVVGLYAGEWVDKRLGTSPLMLIVGVFVGATFGFYSMYRALVATQRQTTRGQNDRDTSGRS